MPLFPGRGFFVVAFWGKMRKFRENFPILISVYTNPPQPRLQGIRGLRCRRSVPSSPSTLSSGTFRLFSSIRFHSFQAYSRSVRFHSAIQPFRSVAKQAYQPFSPHVADRQFPSSLQNLRSVRLRLFCRFLSAPQAFGSAFKAFVSVRFNHSVVPFNY